MCGFLRKTWSFWYSFSASAIMASGITADISSETLRFRIVS